jgi:hypothetical protein
MALNRGHLYSFCGAVVASLLLAIAVLLPHVVRKAAGPHGLRLPRLGEDPAQALLVLGLCVLAYALSAFAWVLSGAAASRVRLGRRPPQAERGSWR